MLKRVLIISLLAFLTMSMHKYYFSFGELQYDDTKKRFEISITTTGHDLENYLKHKNVSIPKLEECVDNQLHLKKIESVLQEGFKLTVNSSEEKSNEENILLELVGMDVDTKDQAIFYMVSRKIEKPKSFSVNYSLLMDHFDEQQNKLTIYTDAGQEFLTFLKHKHLRIFEY